MPKNGRQSLAGAVRQRLAFIERQLEHGILLEVLRQTMVDEGMPSTPDSFRNALKRARARARIQAPSSMATAVPHAAALRRAEACVDHPKRIEVNPTGMPRPINPLLQPKGFVFRGTRGLKKEDLI